MRTKRPLFEGSWYVIAHDLRIAGEWQREYEFEPGEWIIAFLSSAEELFDSEGNDRDGRSPEAGRAVGGRYGEIFRPMDELTSGDWTFDAAAGFPSRGGVSRSDGEVISIRYDKSGAVGKCVFRETGRGTYLYFYDDLPHIPPDMRAIVDHHSHMRYKLVRVWE